MAVEERDWRAQPETHGNWQERIVVGASVLADRIGDGCRAIFRERILGVINKALIMSTQTITQQILFMYVG